MSLKRYAARRDEIEREIVVALRALGIAVLRLSIKDAPDLLVYSPSTGFMLLEVKSKIGTLSAGQRAFPMPSRTVRSVAEALALYGVTT